MRDHHLLFSGHSLTLPLAFFANASQHSDLLRPAAIVQLAIAVSLDQSTSLRWLAFGNGDFAQYEDESHFGSGHTPPGIA